MVDSLIVSGPCLCHLQYHTVSNRKTWAQIAMCVEKENALVSVASQLASAQMKSVTKLSSDSFPIFLQSLLSGTTLVELLGSLRETQVWIVLMRSGGHFAGAVFRG